MMRVRSPLFLLTTMQKIDPVLTASMSDWLNARPAERDIAAGAMMLLQCNRNRALYNSILVRPDKFAGKLEYELRKHLAIRLQGMSTADVARKEAQVMERVGASIASAPEDSAVITPDDELPPARKAPGKRRDHDSLPPEIRNLWEGNAERYRKVKALFEELKGMNHLEPCDRYEKLVILDKTEAAYREALRLYDAYDPENPELPGQEEERRKRISALRKFISVNLDKAEAMDSDDPDRREAAQRLRAAADELLALGAGLAETTHARLDSLETPAS